MNAFMSRTLALSLALVVCLMPLYAHHGTEFLSKAVEMNTAEIDLAEMAIAKTHNPKIKEFAQMVLRDHTEALNKAKELMNARGTGGIYADRVARLQLDSGEWTFYLLPFQANIRDVNLQPAKDGGLSGLWIGHTHQGLITLVEPLAK